MANVFVNCFKCGEKGDHRDMINEGAAKGFQCKSCYADIPKKATQITPNKRARKTLDKKKK